MSDERDTAGGDPNGPSGATKILETQRAEAALSCKPLLKAATVRVGNRHQKEEPVPVPLSLISAEA